MAFHRPGQFAGLFGIDTDNQWKIGGWSYGAVSYKVLYEGNSFSLATANQLNTGSAVISTAAMSGGYQYIGGYNGGIDFRTKQTYGVTPGSAITSMVGAVGQICRLFVNGSGSITLPSNIKWADGSPVWGSVWTIISMWYDGGTFFATTMPFSVATAAMGFEIPEAAR
jgi:hypothetical protein